MNWRRVPHDRKVFGGPHQQVITAIVPWRDGFVAVGEVRGINDFKPERVAVVWISKDGTTWERVPHDEAVFGGKGRQEMFDIAASDDRLVVVGFDEEGPCCSDERSDHDLAIWTSRNGTAWKKHTRAGLSLYRVIGTSGGFIATGGGVWTSRIGTRWSAQPKSGLSGYQAWFATGPDGLVAVGAVGDGPDSSTHAIWTSPDGREWSRATIDGSVHLDDAAELSGVASSESGMAALVSRKYFEDGDGAIIVSADGQTWETGQTPAEIADADLYRVAAIGPHFVAIGGGPMGRGGMPTIWTTFEPGSDMQAEQTSEARRATSTALAAAE